MPQRSIPSIVDYSIVSVDSEFSYNDLKVTPKAQQNPMLAQQGALGGLVHQLFIEITREDTTSIVESYNRINDFMNNINFPSRYNGSIIESLSNATGLTPIKPVERTNFSANSIPEADIKIKVTWSKNLSYFKVAVRVKMKLPSSVGRQEGPSSEYFTNDYIFISNYVEKLPVDEDEYQNEVAKINEYYDEKTQKKSNKSYKARMKQMKKKELEELKRFVDAGSDSKMFSDYWLANNGEKINSDLSVFKEEFSKMLIADIKMVTAKERKSASMDQQDQSNETTVISRYNDRVILQNNYNKKLCSLKKGTLTRLCYF